MERYMCMYLCIYDYSLDVFTVTCGRSGVGCINSIDLHIDGTDGWYVNWVEIDNDVETFIITCNYFLDENSTQRFYRNTQIL